MTWHKIEIEIPAPDFVKQIQINGKKLCIVKDQHKLTVLQSKCPHAGGLLSDGWCENGQLVCPVHRWTYSLSTGRGAEGQGDYVHIYPLEERLDGIYVGFKENWIKKLFK
jgi:nitrite reductase/ring-hydroxylating ferredoxin subunit